jgi:hypothetical protein
MPMLVGVGLGLLLQRVPRLRLTGVGAPLAAALAVAISAWTAFATYRDASPADIWHRGRSMLQATAEARVYPGVCGLAIRTAWVYQTGGYTYWHRDLPIYFETWDEAQKLDLSTFRLRLESVLDSRSVPQYPDAALPANTGRFNVMIGARTDRLPGFSERGCYGRGPVDDPVYCVFTRPGGCE